MLEIVKFKPEFPNKCPSTFVFLVPCEIKIVHFLFDILFYKVHRRDIGIREQMTFGRIANLNWNTCIGSNGNNVFRTMTENRKRSREDDSCEFMPLSKRINNLHINNNLNSNVSQAQDAGHNQINGINTENGISSPSSSSGSERRPSYEPGMSSNQSTYYYDNKLLFELHLERIQRCGQQFPY